MEWQLWKPSYLHIDQQTSSSMFSFNISLTYGFHAFHWKLHEFHVRRMPCGAPWQAALQRLSDGRPHVGDWAPGAGCAAARAGVARWCQRGAGRCSQLGRVEKLWRHRKMMMMMMMMMVFCTCIFLIFLRDHVTFQMILVWLNKNSGWTDWIGSLVELIQSSAIKGDI